MHIHQFQASYQLEHDRILVRLNTTDGQEQRIWFTRRLMMGLFPHLEKANGRLALPSATPVGHDGAAGKAVSDFHRQETLEKTDFETPFQSVQPMLLATDVPLLVTAVHITPVKNESLTLKFDEAIPGTDQVRSIEINMVGSVMLGLMHVLGMALKASGWGVAINAPVDAPATTVLAQPLPPLPDSQDAFAAAQPPKYLN
jgi:hypothetical protein